MNGPDTQHEAYKSPCSSFRILTPINNTHQLSSSSQAFSSNPLASSTMKSIIQVLAFLPLLATSALAQSPTVNCRTVLGTKSVAKVPTSTTTTTDANRATKTVVVQSTVTTRAGWVSTSTRTKTKTETTTDEAVTDVFESTTTVYDVSTITDEATVVSTSTTTSTTSTTSTTIVATTQGFKNIRDTLNSQRLARRAINHPHAAPEKRAVASGAKGVIAQSYPAAVQCMFYH